MKRSHLLITIGLLVALTNGCGSDGDAEPPFEVTTAVEAASATTPSTTTTTTLPSTTTTTTLPSTTTTSEPTTTTVEDLFAAPAVYEAIARDYCSSWPDVAGLLSEDANFIDVPIDGLAVPDKIGFSKGVSEDVVQGLDAVVAAIEDTRFSTVDCGGPATVSGDWVALPVSASSPDGSGVEGIWLFRVVKDKIQWHFIYGTGADEVTPAPAEPDSVLAAEARDFCAIIEGTGYARNADEFLAAMTDDPAVHNNPEGLYWTGVDEVRSMVNYYPSNDDIWCGDAITTNGQWSAEPITIDHPDVSQVGMMVHNHIDGMIHRQFAHFTRTSGFAPWGLPLDE